MYLPDLQLHEPATLGDAIALRTRLGSRARFLAGGTDLLVDLKSGRIEADHLIRIDRLAELRGVIAVDTGVRIGALTTITELDRSPLIAGPYAVVRDATSRMAAPQIRNMATVGGNIASAVPCADLPPVFAALDASVVLFSPDGERSVPMSEFFVGARQTVLREDELLEFIDVPAPGEGFGAAYERFSHREGNAIAVAAVAASLRLDADDTVLEARVALGAVAPTPKLVASAVEPLVGQALDERLLDAAAHAAMHAAEPISDIRGSAEYRRELVGVLTRRALLQSHRRARGMTA